MDLLARKAGSAVAIEIETGKSQPIANVRKCLNAGATQVVTVATSAKAYAEIRRKLRQTGLIDDPRVQVVRASTLCRPSREPKALLRSRSTTEPAKPSN